MPPNSDEKLPTDPAPKADAHSLDGHIEGAVNLRFVAPLPAGSSRVRPRSLLRSGMTHKISPEGLRALASEHRLAAVIDLRTEEERQRGLAAFGDAGVAHHHTPMEDPLDRDPASRRLRVELFRSGRWDWAEVYLRVVGHSGPSLLRALELVAEAPGNAPVMLHCTAGRDRTGISVAMVLHVLGVEREAIADDYARSGLYLCAQVERFFRPAPTPEQGITLEEARRVLDTDRRDLLRFLAALDQQHGSIDAFLASIGVTDDLRAALRARLLESARR